MQGKRLHRFDFGSLPDFSAPHAPKPAPAPAIEAVEPPPPPPPMFDEAALAEARLQGKKEGYQEGYQSGLNQAKQDADHHAQAAHDAVMRIAENLPRLMADYAQLIAEQSHTLGQLTLAIARKVAGEALQTRDHHVIAELMEQCLPVILDQPRLHIDLHPDTLPRAKDLLQEKLAQAGFEGEVIYRPTPTLEAHDVRLDWGNGNATRDTHALWEQVTALIARVPVPVTLPHATEPEASA